MAVIPLSRKPRPDLGPLRHLQLYFPIYKLTISGSVSKIAAENNQKALLELATKPGNSKRRILSTLSALHKRHAALLALLPPDVA